MDNTSPNLTIDNLDLNPRQEQLLIILEKNGYQTIVELASVLKVSEQTIRRDLKRLEDFGFLSKYHGGASIIHKNYSNIKNHYAQEITNKNLSEREVSFVSEKIYIAKAVSDLIPDGSSVFITIGSTVEYIAKELINKKDLLVITDSIRVASILYQHDNIKVVIPSGTIRSFNGGIEGPSTVTHIEQFRTDFMITSIGAIDVDGTLMDFNYTEVALAKVMLKNSNKIIIACDHSKFETIAPVKFSNLNQVNYLVTDTAPSSEINNILQANNVKLICP